MYVRLSTVSGDKPSILFSRIPADVLARTDITGADKAVYCALALRCWVGRIVICSHEKLAKRAGVSKRQVGRSLKNLGEAKLISRGNKPWAKGVTVYRLMSPLFAPKKAKEQGRESRAG